MFRDEVDQRAGDVLMVDHPQVLSQACYRRVISVLPTLTQAA
jgi:hypothetical protein